jgi:Tfp pilus assembly protein PilF
MPALRAHLLGRYALFLEMRGRHDLAERYYRRAIAADPDHVTNRGRYAVFLETVRRDYDGAEAQYRQALTLAPNDPVLLGNFADFLEQARGEYDDAEHFYRRALEAAPYHPNNLVNYATFLAEVRGEYDRAEALYQRALEVAPDHRNGLFKYAIFLTDVRHEYEAAEALYRRGLAVAPNNGAMMANFAGLLLLAGKREEGLAALERALRHPALQQPTADAAECWFYALVHGAPAGRSGALGVIRRLLEAGVRSPGFRLEPHVAIAGEQGHPWTPWLIVLAQVLVDEAEIGRLESWAEWQAASPGPVH